MVSEDLLARARRLIGQGRAVLGICGAPGAGKSTLAATVAMAVGPAAVVVPMDGFHLHDDELRRLGLSERKGAPESFDVTGYVALLRRLRLETKQTVYAPAFDRSRELALAAAIAVCPEHRLVITEGNYLLYDAPDWSQVRAELDEVWFVEAGEGRRIARLVDRHVANGRARDVAERWANGSDQANAELVARTRDSADLLVEVDER
jgi:pantothenate kinase